MERYTLDTHALLWYFTESSSISRAAEICLDQAENGDAIVFVPTIVLAEALSVCEKRKYNIKYEDLIDRILVSTNYSISPFDFEVLSKLKTLQAIP